MKSKCMYNKTTYIILVQIISKASVKSYTLLSVHENSSSIYPNFKVAFTH